MNEKHFFPLNWQQQQQSMIAFSQFCRFCRWNAAEQRVKTWNHSIYTDRGTYCTLCTVHGTVGIWNVSNSCGKSNQKRETIQFSVTVSNYCSSSNHNACTNDYSILFNWIFRIQYNAWMDIRDIVKDPV